MLTTTLPAAGDCCLHWRIDNDSYRFFGMRLTWENIVIVIDMPFIWYIHIYVIDNMIDNYNIDNDY